MNQEIFGHPMAVECDKCKTVVMNIQLTPSILNFNVKCHKCGTLMEAENWSYEGHPKKIEDEYYRKWQSETS